MYQTNLPTLFLKHIAKGALKGAAADPQYSDLGRRNRESFVQIKYPHLSYQRLLLGHTSIKIQANALSLLNLSRIYIDALPLPTKKTLG